MAKSREVRKLDQNRATSSTDNGNTVCLGVFTRNLPKTSGGLPMPIGAAASTYAETREQSAQGHHGAKNREFENVFVVWPYGVTGSEEKKRRLLYNAITRAKNNCIVLDLRKASEVQSDTALRLLGNAKPAFPPRPKKSPK